MIDYATKDVWIFDQKSLGKFNSSATCNFLTFGRFLDFCVFSWKLNIFKISKRKKFPEALMSSLLWRLLVVILWTPSAVHSLDKMFSIPFLCCYFSSFRLFLWTIACNYSIFSPALNFNFMSSLCPLHIPQVLIGSASHIICEGTDGVKTWDL